MLVCQTKIAILLKSLKIQIKMKVVSKFKYNLIFKNYKQGKIFPKKVDKNVRIVLSQ
jgi:hypothetical protein